MRDGCHKSASAGLQNALAARERMLTGSARRSPPDAASAESATPHIDACLHMLRAGLQTPTTTSQPVRAHSVLAPTPKGPTRPHKSFQRPLAGSESQCKQAIIAHSSVPYTYTQRSQP